VAASISIPAGLGPKVGILGVTSTDLRELAAIDVWEGTASKRPTSQEPGAGEGVFDMPTSKSFTSLFISLYGRAAGQRAAARARTLIDTYRGSIAPQAARPSLTRSDVMMVVYPDQVTCPEAAPLRTLMGFCERFLPNRVTILHLLPFFPSSSDDGFAVIDYREVEPRLGTWDDVHRLRHSFRLMVDAVVNHVSSQSEAFQHFLRQSPEARDRFLIVDDQADLTRVVRPRPFPVVHPFRVGGQAEQVWTTFGPDQIDWNYGSPDVLIGMLEVLLRYVAHGAELLRLDAVPYLWKKAGTSCINLPQTHQLVRIMRAVVEEAAPGTKLVAEANVAHSENVAYLGNGSDEAHLVYSFPLPALVLHTLHSGNAEALSRWVAGLETIPSRATFVNFLASHDGVGLNPVRDLLSQREIEALVDTMRARGGLLSFKQTTGGPPEVYELNVNFLDALSHPSSDTLTEERFIAAHQVMLALRGMPAFYFHSLFGSRGWREGPSITGMPRSINRQKLEQDQLLAELNDPDHLRHRVFTRLSRLLQVRRLQAAFDPYGGQVVFRSDPRLFSILRESPDRTQRILCLQNVTMDPVELSFDLEQVQVEAPRSAPRVDLLSGEPFALRWGQKLPFGPYQGRWIVV
jgi:glucosylglycerate phosphorylase